ncbi:MAG: hypothetical protein [Siphoviridae sp. cttb18]|nr:MAG: hypothetical protein [Siphoviridae sp. cttb18]
MDEVKFVGHDLILVPMKMAKHWRMQIDIPLTEFAKVASLPQEMFQEKNYEIIIREIKDEN